MIKHLIFRKVFYVLLLFLSVIKVQAQSVNNCPQVCPNAPNLVINGGFENGNVNFVTQHTFVPNGALGFGDYTITANATNNNPNWSGTPQQGNNFLAIDVSGAPNIQLWAPVNNIAITPNTVYNFSVWVNNLVRPGVNANMATNVQLIINGQVLNPNSCAVRVNPDQWIQICAVWNSGANNNANLSIVSQNPGDFSRGVDIGLDNITFIASQAPLPVITSNRGTSICEGSSVRLTATGGNNISWSTGENGSSILIRPYQTTTYTATNTVNGCTSTSQITLNVIPSPRPDFNLPSELCEGDPVSPVGNSTGTIDEYLWNIVPVDVNSNGHIIKMYWDKACRSGYLPGNGNQAYDFIGSCPDFEFKPGYYAITLATKNTCTSNYKRKILHIKESPKAQIEGPEAICDGNNALLTASGGDSKCSQFLLTSVFI